MVEWLKRPVLKRIPGCRKPPGPEQLFCAQSRREIGRNRLQTLFDAPDQLFRWILNRAGHRCLAVLTEHPQFKSVEPERIRIFPLSGNSIGEAEFLLCEELNFGRPRAEIHGIEQIAALTNENRIVDSRNRGKRALGNFRKCPVKCPKFVIGSVFRIPPPAVIEHQGIALCGDPGEVLQHRLIVGKRGGK